MPQNTCLYIFMIENKFDKLNHLYYITKSLIYHHHHHKKSHSVGFLVLAHCVEQFDVAFLVSPHGTEMQVLDNTDSQPFDGGCIVGGPSMAEVWRADASTANLVSTYALPLQDGRFGALRSMPLPAASHKRSKYAGRAPQRVYATPTPRRYGR